MKNKIRTTMSALLARQRELSELHSADFGGLTDAQVVEYVGNMLHLQRLAKRLA